MTIYKVHKEVKFPKWTEMSHTKEPCHHFLSGFCKKGSQCQFSHSASNCPDYYPTPSGQDNTCANPTTCILRHPKLCLHFMNARCHFGERCLLFHLDLPTHELIPTYFFSALLQSLVENLQKQVQTTKL